MKPFLFTFLIFSHLLLGQGYRASYLYTYTQEDGTPKEELYHLDFQENEVSFYPEKYTKTDSLYHSVGKDIYKMSQDLITYSKHKIFSKYNIKNDHYLELKYLDGEYFLVKNHSPDFNWTILNEERKNENFSSKKATANIGGRSWEAWFSEEIPLPTGPYIFRNLPGLIVEIKDTEGKFKFSLLSIQKLTKKVSTNSFFETDFGYTRPIYTREKFLKLKKNKYLSPIKGFDTDWENKNKEKEFRENKVKSIRKELEGNTEILNLYHINF